MLISKIMFKVITAGRETLQFSLAILTNISLDLCGNNNLQNCFPIMSAQVFYMRKQFSFVNR